MRSVEEIHAFREWTLSDAGLAEVTTACRIRAKHSDLAVVRGDVATRKKCLDCQEAVPA
jgi:hypothetical protein